MMRWMASSLSPFVRVEFKSEWCLEEMIKILANSRNTHDQMMMM